MPRDVNGNYTLPTGNPVATDTTIESNWANSTMQDLAAEMTDSLSRSGKGGVTGPFQIIDQDGSVPGLAYSAEPTSGLARVATGDVRMRIQGNDRMRWRAGAAQVPEVQVSAVWKEVAVLEASRKVMQGVGGETTVFFYNATVPAAAGWSLVAPDANVRSLMIGGTGGTIAGADNPSALSQAAGLTITGSTAGHQLTVGQMPSHNHLENGAPDGAGTTLKVEIVSSDQNDISSVNVTNSTGGDQPHSHGAGTLGGTAAVSFTPRYAMGVLGRLDA